uniref:Peptidase M13 C-terminal domain-containing protein n=1 Tax=Globisporangium ultimum (strain ATCC 200006 / CBS 805.95 / DAOM BR144) TaxID=431595 RepID=K3WBI9_GLOUD
MIADLLPTTNGNLRETNTPTPRKVTGERVGITTTTTTTATTTTTTTNGNLAETSTDTADCVTDGMAATVTMIYRSQERHDWHHDGAYESGDESIEYRHTMNHKRNHHESYDEDEIEYRRRSRRAWGGKERRHEHDDDRSRFENAFAAYATKVVVAANVPRAGNGEAAEIIDDRLFFTAFAQTYCEKRMPAYAELLRTLDLHSPGRWRVNGPLMNFDKFAAAFQCHIGSPMNPEKKCPIW